MIEALDIRVKGIVQGVGFRPFVYRAARKNLINGWVLNAVDGVFIHAEGEGKLLDEFVLELSENPPAASQVEEIDIQEVPLEAFTSFDIRFSDAGAVEKTTLVSPDLATCDDCVHELFNSNNRRFRYPFINCTNCGPRFTIIEQLPYDRANTSMKNFSLCDQCAHEYEEPLNRRFHAQPNACFACGPHISWCEHTGIGDISHEKAAPTTEAQAALISKLAPTPGSAPVATAVSELNPAFTSAPRLVVAEGRAASDTTSIETPLGSVVWGTTREESDAIFARAIELLIAGNIVAVKGLGGFHLVCDANNAQAVSTLRARKHREGKAFAVMMSGIDDVRQVCELSSVEEAVLAGPQRPIVLLKKRADVTLVERLADDLPELGVMLPYTPVQHLLLHDFMRALAQRCAPNAKPHAASSNEAHAGVPMLVMTSGNLHDNPIVTDDDDAYKKLFSVADAFLGNNRPIRARYDDSVVRVICAAGAGEAVQFIRRARGYSPVPIPLLGAQQQRANDSHPIQQDQVDKPASCLEPIQSAQTTPAIPQSQSIPSGQAGHSSDAFAHKAVESIIAVGPEQKNTFTLTRDTEAFVSQHIGDMENAETYDAWLAAKQRYETLFDITPTHLACDLHPEYLTSKWAHEQARERKVSLTQVQHHHAHIVSVMAEHGLCDAVCGIAFDGTGFGVDGAIWGGEVLLSNLQAFERFANFAYVPMPGGAAAIKHPLRMAYGVLWAFDLLDHPGAACVLDSLGSQAQICEQMIEQGINTPMTSSVGRLFDAASALLGICVEPLYEGEPAILLEAAMSTVPPQTDETFYTIDIVKNTATAASTAQDTSVVLFDAASTFKALLDDYVAGVSVPIIARRFHNAFVQAIVDVAELVRVLDGIETVALSGGVFMNRYLIEQVLAALESKGFTVAINRDLPPNDGCVSFGQAMVAWSQDNE